MTVLKVVTQMTVKNEPEIVWVFFVLFFLNHVFVMYSAFFLVFHLGKNWFVIAVIFRQGCGTYVYPTFLCCCDSRAGVCIYVVRRGMWSEVELRKRC